MYDDAVRRLNEAGIPVITHVILGLPDETVTVEGDRRFSLSGMARGLELTCGSEHFGDEVVLFCRLPGGDLACVAFVQPVG